MSQGRTGSGGLLERWLEGESQTPYHAHWIRSDETSHARHLRYSQEKIVQWEDDGLTGMRFLTWRSSRGLIEGCWVYMACGTVRCPVCLRALPGRNSVSHHWDYDDQLLVVLCSRCHSGVAHHSGGVEQLKEYAERRDDTACWADISASDCILRMRGRFKRSSVVLGRLGYPGHKSCEMIDKALQTRWPGIELDHGQASLGDFQ